MKLLQNYISRTVLKSILLVTLILVGLEVLIILVGQVGDIGEGDYTVFQAMIYVFLSLPQRIYELFPLSTLLGCLLGLGYLASHSELGVMRTSGVSMWQIIFSILKATVFLILIVTLLGECIAPFTTQIAETHRATMMSGGQALKTRNGVWIRNKNEYIHIMQIVSHHQLRTVIRYQFDNNNRLLAASTAEKATYDQHQWILHHVAISRFSKTGVKVEHVAKQRWSINLDPKMLGIDTSDPSQLSLVKLHKNMRYRRRNGLNTNLMSLDFWQRLLQPFATVVMVLLAIPFIFGPLRTVTVGVRIIVGVVCGFAFYLLSRFVGPMSLVYQVPPLFAAVLPLLIFFLIALNLLRKVR